mgnify:CR=1 FL=1
MGRTWTRHDPLAVDEEHEERPHFQDNRKTLRVVTYNMRQGGSQANWSELLAATTPDLLLIQETKDPAALLEDVDHGLDLDHLLWVPVEARRWGSAMWWRGQAIRPISLPSFEGWVVGGETRLESESIFVFSVHMPPERGSYLHSANRMLDELKPIVQGGQLLLGGDWNVATARRDPDEERRNRPGELALFDRLESEFGLVSAWRVAHPTGPLPQTLRWMKEPTTPYHCDGLFMPSGWATSNVSAHVLEGLPWTGLSDHNPVVVGFDNPHRSSP